MPKLTVGFDDINLGAFDFAAVNDGYAGLDWSGFGALQPGSANSAAAMMARVPIPG